MKIVLKIKRIDSRRINIKELETLTSIIKTIFSGYLEREWEYEINKITLDIRPSIGIDRIINEIKSKTGEAMWTTWKIVEK